MADLLRLILASRNPVKQGAARSAFASVFPACEINLLGVDALSGVRDQPVGDEETLLGARNRVQHAQRHYPDADFWAGIEGGVAWREGHLEAFAWMYVTDGQRVGEARTASFRLPEAVADLIRQGWELGAADDHVFGVANSKHSSGAAGLLSKGLISREGLYQPAVVLALIPFVNPDLYPVAY